MTARFYDRVPHPLRFEMVLCLVKGDPRALLQMPQHFSRKIDMAIQAGADCRTAERKLTQRFDRFLRARLRVSNLLRVTGKFLPQSDRGRVHQMGPTDLDNVPEFLRLGVESGV